MTTLLYWIVYNFDLGPVFGQKILDLAVRSWLDRARRRQSRMSVREVLSGLSETAQIEPMGDRKPV